MSRWIMTDYMFGQMPDKGLKPTWFGCQTVPDNARHLVDEVNHWILEKRKPRTHMLIGEAMAKIEGVLELTSVIEKLYGIDVSLVILSYNQSATMHMDADKKQTVVIVCRSEDSVGGNFITDKGEVYDQFNYSIFNFINPQSLLHGVTPIEKGWRNSIIFAEGK